ncbi:hypothetical protein PU25_25815, partial [Escherichia coli]
KGVKCQDTRPAFPMVWRIRELNTTVRNQLPSMVWRLRGLNATVPYQLSTMVSRFKWLNFVIE